MMTSVRVSDRQASVKSIDRIEMAMDGYQEEEARMAAVEQQVNAGQSC